jgi:thioredoxin 1
VSAALTRRAAIPSFRSDNVIHDSAPECEIRRGNTKEWAMATAKVTDASFEADVLKSAEPVVVDFWAEWCGPCRMIGPSLDQISEEMAGKVKIVKINVDENPGTAAKFGIRSIPTLMIFKGGALASQKVGAASKGDLSKWIA